MKERDTLGLSPEMVAMAVVAWSDLLPARTTEQPWAWHMAVRQEKKLEKKLEE